MSESGCLRDGHFQNLEVKGITFDTFTIRDDNRWALLGMTSPSLGVNFGAAGSSGTLATADFAVPAATQLVPAAKYVAAVEYIKSLQASDSSITAAQATLLLGMPLAGASTVIGPDTGFETDSLAGTWAGPDLSTRVLTGGITEAVISTACTSDVQTIGMQQLVLFHNVTLTNTHTLTLTTHANSELLDACGKIYVSDTDGTSGIAGLELETSISAPGANSNLIQITPTGTGGGVTTILPGSFLYFSCTSTSVDKMAVHGVLLTSGGTVAVAFA